MYRKHFFTNHAFERFQERFAKTVNQPIYVQEDAVAFFMQSEKIKVDEKRPWIDYYHNKAINCVFVHDRETSTIITVFFPTDEKKYQEAVKRLKVG